MDDNTVELADGRVLGFSDYGPPNGTVVLLFHGAPGSRLYSLEGEPLLARNAVRVIAPDRPGHGLSTLKRDRRIAEWSDDVEQLADQLGLDGFHVAGESGGGPYALSCSVGLAGRVLSTTLIGSAVPPGTAGFSTGMALANRVTLLLARRAPRLLRLQLSAFAKLIDRHPDKAVRALTDELCPWDQEALAGNEDSYLRHTAEAFRQGVDGPYRDLMLITRDWALELTGRRGPLFMWHGECDTAVPIAAATAFAKTLQAVETHIVPGAGHLLLEDDETTAQIIQCMLTAEDS